MLREEDITIRLKCQQYSCECYMRDPEETRSVLLFESRQRTEDVRCPYCQGPVHIQGWTIRTLRDIPIWTGISQEISFNSHRYLCTKCGRTHTEEIPLQYPGTRITQRAAAFIRSMLLEKVSIKTIQHITGIHWETIRNIHVSAMETTLQKRQEELKASGYRPRFLAVDEFAIHKGHTYATCVMDLESGEVLWVGSGRSKEDFRAFFDEIDPSFMADVKAIAMDMNASYHLVVKEKMPGVQIVYDRYHMQAQYGKEVLGVVRLEEARRHKAASQELSGQLANKPKEIRQALKEQLLREKQEYSKIKKLRWTLLTNGEKLSETAADRLQSILDEHSDLAVCYAMKEEMISLFKLRDPDQAREGWQKWFAAAKQSRIPALIRFAQLKEPRLPGLIAHAIFPISTGKLEGFNNKIKVAKRVGFGYRDDRYFFMLVRMLSLPSHAFP